MVERKLAGGVDGVGRRTFQSEMDLQCVQLDRIVACLTPA
jgi:hypothetical protein